jgi:hypothetical protein
LRELSISAGDSRPDLITTAAVDKPFKTKTHRLGTTRKDSSRDELIDSSRKFIFYPNHQLSHAHSIDSCNAFRNACQVKVRVPETRSGDLNLI